MSQIDQLITDYDAKQEQEKQDRQELAKRVNSEQIAIIKNLLGEEVFTELQPHAKRAVLKWNGNSPEFEYPFSGEPLGMVDFTLWVADHGNFELGIAYPSSGTQWLNMGNAGKIFKGMREAYEQKRQVKHQERIKILIKTLENPHYYQEHDGVTDERARQINAELRILDPDRAGEWDNLLSAWLQFRREESLRRTAEERRKMEYEQLKAKFEEDCRAWYVKFLECKKTNIDLAEKYQETYLDQLGKSSNYLLKYGACMDGTMEIMTVQVLEVLPSGDYKIYENGRIKIVHYYFPISLQPIELTPEDRSYWMMYTEYFTYGFRGPQYQLGFYCRPGVDIHTALNNIRFVNPGNFPEPPEGLTDHDHLIITGKIAAEQGE